ncbi:uncharacterized protein LOC114972694 isoform X2 [Acropora millepora]|uniref:uncharacterized protein LOC114972694 isoform X2 n=1 Tax=Acropora millepora TaxID=45264 RepID=UPI001CF219EB|nr:uncharacterized protein LOC114972694 isoform X2 [Acropora millepora]
MTTLLRFWILATISHVAEETKAQQCPSERSISGWMLQRHVYKTMLADIGLHCLLTCSTDDRCQSFNFVMSSHMCEFSDRTKEATPGDFIRDQNRYYFEKRVNRVPLGSTPELAAKSCKEIKMSEKQATSGKYWLSSITPSTPLFAFCNMTTEVVPAKSCNEIFQKQRRTKSQVYTLMLGSRNIPVYCFMGDFGCGSGGWTLVMKTDGTKNTFHYSSPFWSDREVYNLAGGKTGFDKQETKLPSYWETHFSKICLGMRNSLTTRFVVIRRSANSLYSLIADGIYRRFPLGRNKWKYLAGPQASLQTNCNKEGFNVVGTSSQSKARIGIIGNQQNDCSTCDSRIGLGTGGLHDDSNTCGNEATRSSDNGDKHIKAMGYILVQ